MSRASERVISVEVLYRNGNCSLRKHGMGQEREDDLRFKKTN